mgnify:CR=1 FL=1
MKRETILTILLAIAVLLLLKECNRNGKDITFKTKEVRGAFRIDTVTVHDTIKLPTVTYRNGKVIYKTVIDSIDYAIVSKATKIVDSFKQQNDSIKLAMFIDKSTPKNFTKTFDNDTIKVNIFGKYSGEIYGIGMNYTIKPQTINATLKQYTVFLGVNTVSNPSFSNTAVLPTVSYLNANGLLISGGKDLLSKDGYMVGASKSVWSRSRVKAK